MLNKLMSVWKWFRGKRTFLVGLGVIIAGMIECIDGDTSSGVQKIGTGLSAITIRAGINQ